MHNPTAYRLADNQSAASANQTVSCATIGTPVRQSHQSAWYQPVTTISQPCRSQSVQHVEVSRIGQSVVISQSAYHTGQSVRLSNYPPVRLYHSNLLFNRHSFISSHSLESCHSVASVGRPISQSTAKQFSQRNQHDIVLSYGHAVWLSFLHSNCLSFDTHFVCCELTR